MTTITATPVLPVTVTAIADLDTVQTKPHEIWRMLIRGHGEVVRRVEAELMAEHALSLAAFDLLAALASMPERRLRMNELAERVPLSRSGTTRLVDRLQRAGLVVRSNCSYDARGTFAVLTRAGHDRLLAARRTHEAGIEAHCARKLTGDEARELVRALGKLLR
jgi:DNA-binding MarR family transcriptional regulator